MVSPVFSLEKRPREVHVDSLPRMSGPFSQMKKCNDRLFLLKVGAGLFVHCLLDVLVDSRPSNLTAS